MSEEIQHLPAAERAKIKRERKYSKVIDIKDNLMEFKYDDTKSWLKTLDDKQGIGSIGPILNAIYVANTIM